MASVLFFVLDLLGFCLFLSAESRESFHLRPPPGMSRKCMCGDDDHLAWKHPVSS